MSGLGSCSVCGDSATTIYPLLAGSPAFCHGHHNATDAGPLGCDFSGPVDFDIPDEEYDAPIFTGNRKTFTWADRQGDKHKLKDIDDHYLQNIVSFLRRKLVCMDALRATYWSEVIVFLTKEQRIRSKE